MTQQVSTEYPEKRQAGADILTDICKREISIGMISAGIAAYELWLSSQRKQGAYNPIAELVADVYAAMRLSAQRSVPENSGKRG